MISAGRLICRKYKLIGKEWRMKVKMAAIMLFILALTTSISSCTGCLAGCSVQTS